MPVKPPAEKAAADTWAGAAGSSEPPPPPNVDNALQSYAGMLQKAQLQAADFSFRDYLENLRVEWNIKMARWNS